LCYRKDKRLFGISIVPADTVLGLKPKTKIDDVIPSAFPFCELFCCKKGSDIAEMTSTKLSVLLKQEIKTTDKLPPHIVRLLKGDGEPQLPEGLGRVSIIKQTEQDTCK
jgi:hypothetical protein